MERVRDKQKENVECGIGVYRGGVYGREVA